jgi:hypothetical protein
MSAPVMSAVRTAASRPRPTLHSTRETSLPSLRVRASRRGSIPPRGQTQSAIPCRTADALWITTPGEIVRNCESLPKGTVPGRISAARASGGSTSLLLDLTLAHPVRTGATGAGTKRARAERGWGSKVALAVSGEALVGVVGRLEAIPERVAVAGRAKVPRRCTGHTAACRTTHPAGRGTTAHRSGVQGCGTSHGGQRTRPSCSRHDTDTESAAALTLSQTARFATSTVCCCNKIGSCAERWMFCVQPTEKPTVQTVLGQRRHSAPMPHWAGLPS